MKVAATAAVCVLIVMPAAAQSQRQNGSPVSICDNDGHCTTAAPGASNRTSHRKPHTATAEALATTTTAPKTVDTAAAATPSASTKGVVDANGNTAGVVISTKTGARARVSIAYAARFQAYIDDLENNRGARVLFMGGIRPGRCSGSSQHPCRKALDVCQLRRGVVDPRCNMPDRAAVHGLFEGGRWCQSDYGHAQIGVTAAACGDGRIRIVRRTAAEPIADGSYP